MRTGLLQRDRLCYFGSTLRWSLRVAITQQYVTQTGQCVHCVLCVAAAALLSAAPRYANELCAAVYHVKRWTFALVAAYVLTLLPLREAHCSLESRFL
jgi:hypothetical protein